MAGRLKVICREASGAVIDGLPVVEGARQLGRTGAWLLLSPRLYTLCIRRPDGALTAPPHDVDVLDFQEQEIEISLTTSGGAGDPGTGAGPGAGPGDPGDANGGGR